MKFDKQLVRAYLICAVVSLIAIWAHRYPAGIDLPQHANVFTLWARLHSDGYSFFYKLHAFTPYLLTYSLAYPFTVLFGALIATKILITIIALLTPYLLIVWLKEVKGELWWGLLGFLVAFGFSYFWGFISFSMSVPLMFLYLTHIERLKEVTLKRVILCSILSILLFFCHAITFGVVSLIAGLRSFRGKDWKFILRGLHLVPSSVLLLLWYRMRQQEGQVPFAEWPPDPARLLNFFSGLFRATPTYVTIISGLALFVFIFLISRPQISKEASRYLPLAIGSLGFIFLPETMASTWLVGTRFIVFVHAFIPIAFQPTVSGKNLTYMRWATASVVVLCLISLNVRLFGFNQELKGLAKITASLPENSDVHGLLVDTGWHSWWVGDLQMGQVMAWATAEKGGVLENDQARYFPIPIQRRDEYPWQKNYQFLIARGPADRAVSIASRFEPSPKVVNNVNNWVLIESSAVPLSMGDLEVIRYGQQWGSLQLNQSVEGQALVVAGQSYERGLGTCPKSIIQVRSKKEGRFLEGHVGLNDTSGGHGSAVFKVMDEKKNILFESGIMTTGMPAQNFKVEFHGKYLFLVTEPVIGRGINYAHADWLDLVIKGES